MARERERTDIQAQRGAFIQQQARLDASRLIFIDESGFRLGAPPHYGWAPLGEKSPGKSTQRSWKTMTMIGALALDGFRGFMTIDATTSSDVFHAFVEQELLPHLRRGDVVVMDNWSAHKTAAVLKTIRNAGAEALFLPAYSPQYNPIEKAWSKMKTMMRRLNTTTPDAFDSAVAQAMDAVTPENIEAWVRYAGYCH